MAKNIEKIETGTKPWFWSRARQNLGVLSYMSRLSKMSPDPRATLPIEEVRCIFFAKNYGKKIRMALHDRLCV